MDDLIRRSDIVNRLKRVIEFGAVDEDGCHPMSAEGVLEGVMGIPAVTSVPEWTECEDGMPEHYGRVWVTLRDGNVINAFYERGFENCWQTKSRDYTCDEVLAWMPNEMPKPYRKVKQDGN